MSVPTQAELDQPDPIGGAAVFPDGGDINGDPAVVAGDQEPVSRFGAVADAVWAGDDE